MYCITLYYIILHYIISYYIVSYYIVLYYITLHYVILYYTIHIYILYYIYTHIITIYKLLYVFAQSEHTVKHYTMPPNFPRPQLPKSSRSPLCPNHLPPRMVRSFTAKKHVLMPLEIGIEQQKRNLYEQPKVDSTWLTNKIQGVIWCFFQPTCWDFSKILRGFQQQTQLKTKPQKSDIRSCRLHAAASAPRGVGWCVGNKQQGKQNAGAQPNQDRFQQSPWYVTTHLQKWNPKGVPTLVFPSGHGQFGFHTVSWYPSVHPKIVFAHGCSSPKYFFKA